MCILWLMEWKRLDEKYPEVKTNIYTKYYIYINVLVLCGCVYLCVYNKWQSQHKMLFWSSKTNSHNHNHEINIKLLTRKKIIKFLEGWKIYMSWKESFYEKVPWFNLFLFLLFYPVDFNKANKNTNNVYSFSFWHEKCVDGWW